MNVNLDLRHFGLATGIITANDGLDTARKAVKYGVEVRFNKYVQAAIRTAVAKGVVESLVQEQVLLQANLVAEEPLLYLRD